MPIKEIELFYGAVFSKLANHKDPVSIKPLDYETKGFYLINESIPIYIKYTSKRLSPWRFSFIKVHQDELLRAKTEYGKLFIAFVCGHDGICCIEFDQFKRVLDHVHEEVEWVAIRRKRNECYAIKGNDGELKGKISVSDFPSIMLNNISHNAMSQT